MQKLPEQFVIRMQERLGKEFPAFLASYETPPCRGLRVNPLKIGRADFEKISSFALEAIPWEQNGYYITEDKAGADVYHFAGLYYMQEPSAMCAAPMLGVQAGERVLDLCAAPGGKSTQLAAALGGEGILVANEIDFGRARTLSQNIERLGVVNSAVTCAPPERLKECFPEYFDKILVDAPCSGEGMFKKEPEALSHWSPQNVTLSAARQKGILDAAADMLAGGGKLVYSTCTFSEEEDEGQIAAFLERHPAFELIEMKKLLPHEIRGEGHFAACLYKKEGESQCVKPYPVKRNRAANAAYEAFARDFFEEVPKGEITALDDGRLYLVPKGMPALSVRTLRLGVELGEWDGKLFKPAHALAMALGQGAKHKVNLSREAAIAYLHGETISSDIPNGWCVVCVDGYPLGLGKAVNGVVKNHLPKGLRMIK